MTRICDGSFENKPCPRKNQCVVDCHFNTAALEVEIDQRWIDQCKAETSLIVASWAFVVFVVTILFGMAYAVWGLL